MVIQLGRSPDIVQNKHDIVVAGRVAFFKTKLQGKLAKRWIQQTSVCIHFTLFTNIANITTMNDTNNNNNNNIVGNNQSNNIIIIQYYKTVIIYSSRQLLLVR